MNELTRRVGRRALLPALAAGAVLVAPVVGAPGERLPHQAAEDDPRNTGVRVRDELVFRRADGSRVGFEPDVAAWCGPWEPGEAATPAVHVFVGARNAHWELSAVVADVQRHPAVRLPHSFVFDEPEGALLFAAAGGNELSSGEEEARGRITFHKVRCDERLVLDFSVRATLGSEFFEGERMKVRGRFRVRSAPPASP